MLFPAEKWLSSLSGMALRISLNPEMELCSGDRIFSGLEPKRWRARHGAGNRGLVDNGSLLVESHRNGYMYCLRDNQHKPQG